MYCGKGVRPLKIEKRNTWIVRSIAHFYDILMSICVCCIFGVESGMMGHVTLESNFILAMYEKLMKLLGTQRMIACLFGGQFLSRLEGCDL